MKNKILMTILLTASLSLKAAGEMNILPYDIEEQAQKAASELGYNLSNYKTCDALFSLQKDLAAKERRVIRQIGEQPARISRVALPNVTKYTNEAANIRTLITYVSRKLTQLGCVERKRPGQGGSGERKLLGSNEK
ncbi:hypothetical protein M1446_04175 [Candidatus Dependentiae bacterium]|nr:hypothetical protein [Candidatus Dependentiae bacterium]